MKPRKTSKRIAGMVIGVITGILAMVFVNEMLYPENKSENKIKAEIKRITDELNNVTPLMVNENTRFDSIAIKPNNTLQYYYTVTNVYCDSVNIVNFESRYKPMLIQNIKSKDGLAFILNYKIYVIYQYRDKEGKVFSTIDIDPNVFN